MLPFSRTATSCKTRQLPRHPCTTPGSMLNNISTKVSPQVQAPPHLSKVMASLYSACLPPTSIIESLLNSSRSSHASGPPSSTAQPARHSAPTPTPAAAAAGCGCMPAGAAGVASAAAASCRCRFLLPLPEGAAPLPAAADAAAAAAAAMGRPAMKAAMLLRCCCRAASDCTCRCAAASMACCVLAVMCCPEPP